MEHYKIYDKKRGCYLENCMPVIEDVPAFCKRYPNVVYCDIEGILADPYGCLYILDECGNWEPADPEDYEVRWLKGDKYETDGV